MSGSDLQGRWMPSSVTEEDVLKLRDARYLTDKISHRLPAQGQVIPTPKPGESVVFASHFLRGLGFPMDPFVRGLMFYYGLEFHDLDPDIVEGPRCLNLSFGCWNSMREADSIKIERKRPCPPL